MRTVINPPRSEWADLLARPVQEVNQIEAAVQPIMDQVRNDGDKALFELTKRFDGVELEMLQVTKADMDSGMAQVSEELKQAIRQAAKNIETFHAAQRTPDISLETTPGVICSRKSVPIERVGLYIPGGTAPLFSTVLMLGVPAQIAGCKEVVLCTPPNQEGDVHPAILFAASLVGIDKLYKVGGAQAIAAMTFGTESVPKVYKIFGPGNQYVTAAKQLATKYGVAIDMPAGPSEVAVYADETAVPAFVAADLLSQAEHGADSQVLLVTDSEKVVDSIKVELDRQLEELPRKDIAKQALDHSICVVMEEEAIDLLNEYGAEHLILAIKDYDQVASRIVNAGSVFLGNLTPESAGDYASGTNHTLPTNGYAKAFSGVSLDSFVKKITYQEITEEGLQNIGNIVEVMAEAEQLVAHKNAITVRLKSLSNV